jgi:hypothetical protein
MERNRSKTMTHTDYNLQAGLSKLRKPGSSLYEKALVRYDARVQSGKSERVAIMETLNEAANTLAVATKQTKLDAAYEAAGVSRKLLLQNKAKATLIAVRSRLKKPSNDTTTTKVIVAHSEDEDDAPERSTTVILLMLFLGIIVGALVAVFWIEPLAVWLNDFLTGHHIDTIWLILVMGITVLLFTVVGGWVGVKIFNRTGNRRAKVTTTTMSAEEARLVHP